MQCPKCKMPLVGEQLTVYLVSRENIEVQLSCNSCPAVFSTWIDHTGWADAASEPADLTGAKPTASKTKLNRGGRP